MPSKLITPPQDEPITLAQAKVHIRVTDTAQDSRIRTAIASSRAEAENGTRRGFMTQSWGLYLDAFPLPVRDIRFGVVGLLWPYQVQPVGAIYLARSPVQSVTSVKYYDPSGAQQTLDPALYLLDNVSEPGRLFPAPGNSWPAMQVRPNSIEVVYVVGYGDDAENVPGPLIEWMLNRIGVKYENREEQVIEPRVTAVVGPDYVEHLLDHYIVPDV